jgi:hypothetical protein
MTLPGPGVRTSPIRSIRSAIAAPRQKIVYRGCRSLYYLRGRP